VTVDEGDRRLQDRQPPLERAGGGLVRIATFLGPAPQPFDVVT